MLSELNIAFINIILCTFFSFITAPVVKRIGEKFNIFDIPDSRKVHTHPIVRIGGLSIFITFFLYFLISKNLFDLNIFYSGPKVNLSSIFVGAVLYFLIGIHDDVFKSSPLLRLFLQFLIAFVVAYCGINFGTLGFNVPFYGNIYFYSLDCKCSFLCISRK